MANVRVNGSDDNTFKVEVTREVKRADDAEAAKLLKEERLTVKRNGDDVSITAVEPASLRHRFWWWITQPNLDAHYVISLPRGYKTHVETMGGEVRMTGLKGGVYAKTMGGEMDFDDIAGEVDGHTMGGDVTIKNFSGLSIQAHTMGGSVSADFAIAPKSDSELHTMGGEVTARLPAGAALRLDAHTMGGSVRSDLPVQVEGKQHDNSLKGTINGGGPLLKMTTMGGDIDVLKRN